MRFSWPTIGVFLGMRRTGLQCLNFGGDKDFDGSPKALWLIRCLCVSPHLLWEHFSTPFTQKVMFVYLGAINKMSKQFALNTFSYSEA